MSKKKEASLEAENSSLRAEVSELRAELGTAMSSLKARCEDLRECISVLDRRGLRSPVSSFLSVSMHVNDGGGAAAAAATIIGGNDGWSSKAPVSPGRHIARIEAENDRYRLMVADRDRQLLELQSELQAHKSTVQNFINTGQTVTPAHGSVFQSSALTPARRHGVALARGGGVGRPDRPAGSNPSSEGSLGMPPGMEAAVTAAPPMVRSVATPGAAQRVEGSPGITPPPTPSPRLDARLLR
mmetsp:Transcript_122199/g.211280  ORF Transcript_122199/g.211280 Transcript_122199/m.211280 type:complete len:242 (+) Transcript_122199:192-917(+)